MNNQPAWWQWQCVGVVLKYYTLHWLVRLLLQVELADGKENCSRIQDDRRQTDDKIATVYISP